MNDNKLHKDVYGGRFERFFMTWRFPSFMLLTLLFFWLLMMGMAFMPVTDSAWGTFAEDFKVWCFGYDPDTGSLNYMYLVGFTIQPLVLALFIYFVWRSPVRYIIRNPRKLKKTAYASLSLVAVTAVSFPLLFEPPAEPEYEFQASALRVALPDVQFSLIDANKDLVTNDDYYGKVVILTSVYASCSETCPLILDQAKRVLDRLKPHEREQVIFKAITMQPEKDTPDLLARVAEFYRLQNYQHHLLTGEPERVHSVLDDMGVARQEIEETGEIGHVNLFLIKDRKGKIAFRFSLGESQEDWMVEALKLLIAEEVPTSLAEIK